MGRMTRRQFFGCGKKAALTVAAAGCLHGCPPGTPPLNPVSTTSRVAAVRGLDLYAMTREALEAFGGAANIIQPGERILVKPNFGAFGMVKYDPVHAGDAVKPEIVITVAEECLKAGAAEVIIGEGGQANVFSWAQIKTLDGLTNVEAEAARMNDVYAPAKVTLACLNSQSPAWDMVPTYTKLNNLYVSSMVTRADRVISIPVIKSHRWTYITGALKNFVGTTSTFYYGMGIQWRFMLHDAGIEQSFLDVVNAVRPCFTIVDGSICCEGNGPHVMPGYWGTTVDVRDRLGQWLLLASNDLAAADATVARVISHDVSQIPFLNMAYNMGLGQIREDMIQIDGATLGELQIDWEPAQHTEGFSEVLIPGLHLLMDS